MAEGKLYVVATPIGNLEDITKRACRILGEADVIAAEDTRHTAALLNSLGIKNRLMSFHEHSEAGRAEELVTLLKEGKNIALVTDAGTPLVSDPGEALTRRAAEEGVEIVSVPGPCAAIAGLSVSALEAGKFTFEGFLPRDKTRKAALQKALSHEYTTILYESPHHLKKTLSELAELDGARPAALAKELTKVYEHVFRGTLSSLAQTVREMEEVRGEYVLVLAGAEKQAKKAPTDQEAAALLIKYIAGGMKKKAAVQMVAETLDLPKNKVYELSLQI